MLTLDFFQSFNLKLIAFNANSAKVAKLWCLGNANLNIVVLHSSRINHHRSNILSNTW